MRLLDVPLLRLSGAPAADQGPPLVRATIEGKGTLLVVDTGATETLITRSFAERLGLPLAPAEPGRDHTDLAVETWTGLAPVSLEIGAFQTSLTNAAIVGAPAHFDRSGIGGVLCPQLLHATAGLWLDFSAERMLLIEADPDRDPVVPDPALRVTNLELVRLPGDEASLVAAFGHFADSAAHGIMFNTGSWEAELSPGFAPPTPDREVTRGFGLSGAAARAKLIGAGHFVLGDAFAPAADVLVRPQPAGLGGQVGMQILQYTALEINLAGRQLRWWTPAAWIRRR